MPSFLSICLALLKFAIATADVILALLIELHNAVERLRDEQYSSITLSTEDKSSDLSLIEPSNSETANAETVDSSTESTKSSDFAESFSTTNSGTESVTLSEPNNLTIFDPLREESMPPAFSLPLKSQESNLNENVGSIDEPLLTKNYRIDSMENIELVARPTCEFIPPEASIFPQMPSQFSSPSLADSDTPENIKYIEKASRVLMTVCTQPGQEQEYSDINSSTTEFPGSGSPISTTDNEDAVESANLPQLHVESLSSTENDISPSKECNTQSSVRFLLPDSHIEREGKGFRRESKFRKKTNETSTSEEENETKVSRKRRASPDKFHKSPKKFAETTASKIRRYKLSPQNKSDEKKGEEMFSCENASGTRSLDFGFQQKSENATDLLTSKDQKNRKLKSEELNPRTIEDDVNERASFQQATLKSESVDDTCSKSDSISKTSSVRVGDDIAGGAGEFSPKIGTQEPIAVANSLVDSAEKGSLSSSESKQVFPTIVNETFAFQEIEVDSKADFTFEGDASNNSLLKDSTYSTYKSCEMLRHLELVDTNAISHESKLLENDGLVSDQNNETRIDEVKNAKLESTLNIHSLPESEQNSNCNIQLETTNQASNDDSSKESETLPSEKLINEMSGKDSCYEGVKSLASHVENKAEFEEYLNSDRNKNSPEDKSESPNFSISDNSIDKNLVKYSTLEAETDNFGVLEEASHQINTIANVDNMVQMNETFSIGQSKTDVESMEVSSSSLHPETIHSRSEEQNPEIEKPTGETESENKNVSSLLSPSKSSSSEGDEERTTSKAAEETSDYQFSNLSNNLKKLNSSKCFFTPVLEELAQRFETASRSNSPAKPQALLPTLELRDNAEVSSDLQLSTIKTDVNKVSNYKNYFNIVLKDLVQKVNSATVSNSFTSIKDEESRVPEIEVLSKTSLETSLQNYSKASILEETEMKVNGDVHSDNLVTDAEDIKQENMEFELLIVPQPVPYETAIQIKVENLIPNETSSYQSQIKIIDSKISENELNAPDITPAEYNICHLTANQENGDSYSRCPVATISNEEISVEILPSNDDFSSSKSSTIEALVGLTKNDSTSNTFVEMPKDNYIEIAVNEVKNNDISENTHLEVTNECTEKALIEMTKDFFADYVEETKDDLTENSLIIEKEESTGSKLVEVSKDHPTENNSEATNYSNESTLVKMAKCDSTENKILEVVKDDLNRNNFDVMHDCSAESNSVDTSTNLDSSVAEEASANDKEESSNENKPWKKKQRKSKKKRRN